MQIVMMRWKIFKLLCFCAILGVAGCYRISYKAYGSSYFKIEEGGKMEVLSVLDKYAKLNGFVKTQEGGERLTEYYKAIVINAAYRNQGDFSYRVMNMLDHKCFSLHAYDNANSDPQEAMKIASDVKAFLSSAFDEKITFYKEQGCINAT